MSIFIWILSGLAIALAVYSIFYTVAALKEQKAVKGDLNPQVNEKVRQHPYLLNPVFLALAISALLIAGFIFYYAFS